MSSQDGKLTPKQRAFVDQYVIDKNATKAAVRAGYKEKNAHVVGPRMSGLPHVKAAIEARLAKIADKADVTVQRVLEELAGMGFAPISITQENARLLGVKRQALANIGDHLGMFKSTVEHTGRDGGPIEYSNIERARRLVYLLKKAAQEQTAETAEDPDE